MVIHYDPVGQRTNVMLPNYDAKAIAEGARPGLHSMQRKPKEPAAVVDFIVGGDDRFVIVEQAIDGSGKTGPSQAKSYLAPSVAFLERAVEVGFPRVALRRLVERLAGDDKSKIRAWNGMSFRKRHSSAARTSCRRKKASGRSASRDCSCTLAGRLAPRPKRANS